MADLDDKGLGKKSQIQHRTHSEAILRGTDDQTSPGLSSSPHSELWARQGTDRKKAVAVTQGHPRWKTGARTRRQGPYPSQTKEGGIYLEGHGGG